MRIIQTIKCRLINLLNERIKRTNWYKNQLVDKELYPTNEWYRSHSERNFNIVNIGSSSAITAFNYKYSNLKGLNWAGKPQSMELGFKIFKNFFSILGPKGMLCIPLGPFTGLTAPWTGTKEEFRFFGVLDSSLFTDYKKVAFVMETPLLSSTKTAIKRLLKDEPIQGPFKPRQLTTPEQYVHNAEHWIEMLKKEFNITDLESSIPNHLIEGHNKRLSLINEIFAFCKERQIQVSIAIPPVHPALSKYFTPKFKQIYLEPIVSIARTNNSLIMDMLNNSDFQSSDFADSFYLNDTGSQKFMLKLESEINSYHA